MPPDPNAEQLLRMLADRTAEGHEIAALDLHLRALMTAREGDVVASAAAFAAAQEWESANGYARAALHTSHQAALTMNFGGDLERLKRYYRETIGTLKRLKNREGLALCLRSFGELALLDGAAAEVAKAWELSERLFTALGLAESRQIAAWIATGSPDRCLTESRESP
jgi:hypothetical protein